MRIEIVATYINRLPQLLKTVASLNRYRRDDFELIVVDDGSSLDINGWLNTNFPVGVLRMKNKTWFNSCIPYNEGFRLALSRNPEIVIIQNAECFHSGDILGYAERNLTDKNYIAFPCYSLGKDDKVPPEVMNNRCATSDGDSAWYNHPVHRPVGYHFCAAITADNLYRLNGFDERFINGHDYEDNYWLHQVRSLGLRIDIPAEPYVFHQWHYSSNRPRGTGNNEALYQELSKENSYRAVHLLTRDL